ncbi:hypothetical protein Tco_0118556, partial [Tanacetum coccineum]
QKRLNTGRERSELRTYQSFESFLSTSTVSIGSFRNERIVGATARTIRQGLYKTQFLTLGSSSFVCQKEERIILDMHRLSGIEQADGEESLSTPKD